MAELAQKTLSEVRGGTMVVHLGMEEVIWTAQDIS
jgi:hypothetical protein